MEKPAPASRQDDLVVSVETAAREHPDLTASPGLGFKVPHPPALGATRVSSRLGASAGRPGLSAGSASPLEGLYSPSHHS